MRFDKYLLILLILVTGPLRAATCQDPLGRHTKKYFTFSEFETGKGGIFDTLNKNFRRKTIEVWTGDMLSDGKPELILPGAADSVHDKLAFIMFNSRIAPPGGVMLGEWRSKAEENAFYDALPSKEDEDLLKKNIEKAEERLGNALDTYDRHVAAHKKARTIATWVVGIVGAYAVRKALTTLSLWMLRTKLSSHYSESWGLTCGLSIVTLGVALLSGYGIAQTYKTAYEKRANRSLGKLYGNVRAAFEDIPRRENTSHESHLTLNQMRCLFPYRYKELMGLGLHACFKHALTNLWIARLPKDKHEAIASGLTLINPSSKGKSAMVTYAARSCLDQRITNRYDTHHTQIPCVTL